MIKMYNSYCVDIKVDNDDHIGNINEAVNSLSKHEVLKCTWFSCFGQERIVNNLVFSSERPKPFIAETEPKPKLLLPKPPKLKPKPNLDSVSVNRIRNQNRNLSFYLIFFF